jgi:hypothetical protein
MVYPALPPLMRTPRLPIVDKTDAPADLSGLVRFAERRNLVSVHVPSHFKRSLVQNVTTRLQRVKQYTGCILAHKQHIQHLLQSAFLRGLPTAMSRTLSMIDGM